MASEETFALVIGAGPVGMIAALDLHWRGVPVVIVNDRTGTSTHPKCNHTSGRSLEYLRRIGVANELRSVPSLNTVQRDVEYMTTFCGFEIGRTPFALPMKNGDKPVGGLAALRVTAEPPVMIPQPALEAKLKELLEKAVGDNVRFGWKATEIIEESDRVIVPLRHVETGEERVVSAKYVVACDGAGSLARRTIGAVLEGESGGGSSGVMSGSMLSYHVESPNLVEVSGRPAAMLTTMITHRFRAISMLQNDGTRWIFHFQVPQGKDGAEMDARDVVRTMIGNDDVEFDILSGGPWAGGLALVADRYQSRRIFLAGDAAHLYTPMGGTGMNVGIGDAINVCWKVAAVHDGWAGNALTGSYELERRPIGIRNSRFGVDHAKIHAAWILPEDLEEAGPVAAENRRAWGEKIMVEDRPMFNAAGVLLGERYEGSPIVAGDNKAAPADDLFHYTPSDRAGGRLPHYWLADGRALQDLLGPGYTLLCFENVDTAPLETAAAAAGMPLSVIKAPPAPVESGITHPLVLVRPDLYIAWSGPKLPDAEALVDRVRGAIPQHAIPTKVAA